MRIVLWDRTPKAEREIRWLDYLLVFGMNSLAIFTAGQGVQAQAAAAVLIGISAIGTLFSYYVGKLLLHTTWLALDGWVYLLVAVVAFLFPGALNSALPYGGFPQDVWAAGFLCWMICLGSFGCWRDGPLLFQAVPGMALFGLVGVYDTYRPATFLFFAFLLLIALLFGRAHSREMLRLAFRSGFTRTEEGISVSEVLGREDAMLRAMRRGPWRWMAGPEWALASAGAVILVSVLGAPILQASVSKVSTFVQVNVPQRLLSNAVKNLAHGGGEVSSLTDVGTGPRTLSQRVVAVATLDNAAYLREVTYSRFSGRGWQRQGDANTSFDFNDPDIGFPIERESLIQSIRSPVHHRFIVQIVDPTIGVFPLPAEVDRLDSPSHGVIGPADGAIPFTYAATGDFDAKGDNVTTGLDLSDPAVQATLRSEPDPDIDSIPSQVTNWARSIAAKQPNDYAKAEAVMQAIGHQCQYNLDAPATPESADPVEYFLFTSHTGYCDLFASSMVEAARSVGLTARYAVGYLTSPDDRDEQGRYLVRASDAHAWAEVYFSGAGWVIFDPTAYATDVTPKHNSDTTLSVIEKIGGGIVGLGILGALGFVVWKLFGGRFARKKTPSQVIARRRLGKAYSRFADTLAARSGIRRTANTPPDTWLAQVGGKIGVLEEEATEINAAFVRAFYAPDEDGPEAVAALERRVRAFRKRKPR